MTKIKNSDSAENKKEAEGESFKKVAAEEIDRTVAQIKERAETKPEMTEDEIKELRQKIEETDMEESLKAEALAKAENIKSLREQEKISELLEIAKKKGVVFAVNVAKKMNDSYVLDALHDALEKDGFYKEFLK